MNSLAPRKKLHLCGLGDMLSCGCTLESVRRWARPGEVGEKEACGCTEPVVASPENVSRWVLYAGCFLSI